MNKRQESIVNRYFNSYDTELWEVYGSFSQRKWQAFEDCKRIMKERDGYGLRIIGHNTSFFSVGFRTKDDKTLVYITHCGTEDIPLD